MSEWRFRDELKLKPINLPRAALLYARDIAYPKLNIPRYMRHLDEISSKARPHVKLNDPLQKQAECLAGFLFEEHGLRGNEEDFFDPRNSYLNDVIDRRLGIPITLSMIFLHVANNLGVAAHGISLPGHFIVAVRNDDLDVLLDPFNGGQVLSRTDCEILVRSTSGYKGAFEPSWLVPVSPKNVLVRMLNNLRMVYVNNEEWTLAKAVIEHLSIVQPDHPEHLRDLGLLHYQQGAIREAAHFLNRYVASSPEAPEVETIKSNVWQTIDRWVRAN